MTIKEIRALQSNDTNEISKVIGIIEGFAKLPQDTQKQLSSVFENFLNNK